MNGRRRALLVSALLSMAIPAGCKGTTAPAPKTLAEACGDLVDAIAAYAACEGVPPLRYRDRQVDFCTAVLSGPGVPDSAASVEACAQALGAAAPTCGGGFEEACTAPPGTLPKGAPCLSPRQCASGYCEAAGRGDPSASYIDLEAVGGCGTCQDAIAIGQPCVAYGTPCVSGAQCDYTGVVGQGPGTCRAVAPPSGAGGACALDGNPAAPTCKAGLRCDERTSTCAAPSAAGGPCVAIIDCAYPLVCVDMQCAAPVAEGQPCTNTASGASTCARDAVCDGTHGCVTPAIVGLGEACDETTRICGQGFCFFDSPIDGGAGVPATCRAAIPDGQPCDPADFRARCDLLATCVVPGTTGGGGGPAFPEAGGGGPGGPGGPSDGGVDEASAPPPAVDAGPPGTCVRLDPAQCH